MKQRKWLACSGLAFDDKEDMEILHKYALKGWIFREYRYGFYILHKEEPQNLVFGYDIKKLKKNYNGKNESQGVTLWLVFALDQGDLPHKYHLNFVG